METKLSKNDVSILERETLLSMRSRRELLSGYYGGDFLQQEDEEENSQIKEIEEGEKQEKQENEDDENMKNDDIQALSKEIRRSMKLKDIKMKRSLPSNWKDYDGEMR